LPCIAIDLGHQAANGVTLEQRMALRTFAAFAIANFVQANQVTAMVVFVGDLAAQRVGFSISRENWSYLNVRFCYRKA
jgi:hypothetical protein